jgi:hypothetical protein
MIDVKDLHQGMRDQGYICTPLFATQVASALSSKPTRGVILKGPAGVGKSFLPEVIAKVLDVEMFWHQLSPGTHETDLLLKMYPSESTKAGMTVVKSTIYEAAVASQKGMVLLVLDEWDKSRPSADGMFLDFFQSGRLPLPPQNGVKIKANLDNLLIIITMNDERNVTEPFLRRFSKIDIEQLAPTLVLRALQDTHPDHPYLENALSLYCRALVSEMTKPVTIQELRQLLDAISSLGKYADWNTLVFQFVTKEEENHIMLKNAENLDLEDEDLLRGIRRSAKLDSSAYGNLPTQDNEVDVVKPMLPRISEVRKWKTNIVETTFEDIGDCYGILEKTEDAYTKMALLGDSTDNPSDFGWIKNCSTTLALEKPVDLDLFLNRREMMDGGWGLHEWFRAVRELNHGYSTSDIDETKQTGEIMFRLPFVERSEFIRLVRYQGHIINKMTSDEVISRGVFPLERDRGGRNKIHTSEVNFRWRKEKGIDVIVPLSGMVYFRDIWETSTRSSLIADGTGRREDVYCASNNFFNEQKTVPLANMRSMRHFSNVARYGLTRFPDRRGILWQKLNDILLKTPGVVCTETDVVNPGLHLFFPTDWVESKSITIGRYKEPFSGTFYCEVRINGSLDHSTQLVFSEYSSGSIPVYVPVFCKSRKLLNKLTSGKNRWKRSTKHTRTIMYKGLHFTTCGNAMGYFWSCYPCYIGNGNSTRRDMASMLCRMRYYQDKYNGFK